MHDITKEKLEAPFLREDELLKWPCGCCMKDFMIASSEDIFVRPSSIEKTYPYEDLMRDGEREYNIKEGAKPFFSLNVVCESCQEPAVLYGLIAEDLDLVNYKTEQKEAYEPLYNIEGISLSLLPIQISSDTPDDVVRHIRSAARHMFGDIPACANYLRKAVEAIMEDAGVSGGNQHQKIESFKKKYEDEGELLMAAKWIGNDGSHMHDNLDKEDVIECFESLEEVIRSLYNSKRKKRIERARKRNLRNGKR